MRMEQKKGLQRRTLDFSLEVKQVEDTGVFKGYGSVFDVMDDWHDVVLKGAFAKSLERRTPAMLWQHNSDEPIGVYTSIAEDDMGLSIEGRLLVDGVAKAKEAHVLLKNNAIRGLSIGFIPIKWEWETRNDTRVRLLKEVDLWEVSLVTFPANAKALIGDVKSAELKSIRDVEDYLRDAGLARSEAKAAIAAIKASALRDAEEAEAVKAVNELLRKIRRSA